MKRFPELNDGSQRGSKPRCHLFTDGTRVEVAGRLTALVKPYGLVRNTDNWMPEGFQDTAEVQLHEPNALISTETSRDLKEWWLESRAGSSPHWDLISQCLVGHGRDRRPGLLLIEAKAHSDELKTEGKSLSPGASNDSRRNHRRIGYAIEEANVGLRSLTCNHRWALSRDNCYQMANRFAWAWKLADLGVPVILVYLGFLDAVEMSDKGDPFFDHADWEACIKTHANNSVPREAWERCSRAPDGTFLVPRILSIRQSLTATRSAL